MEHPHAAFPVGDGDTFIVEASRNLSNRHGVEYIVIEETAYNTRLWLTYFPGVLVSQQFEGCVDNHTRTSKRLPRLRESARDFHADNVLTWRCSGRLRDNGRLSTCLMRYGQTDQFLGKRGAE